MASRFGLVALLLLPFAKRPTGQWGAVFAISITLGLLHFSFMFNGLKSIDAATASIAIQLQVPVAVQKRHVEGKRKSVRRDLGGHPIRKKTRNLNCTSNT